MVAWTLRTAVERYVGCPGPACLSVLPPNVPANVIASTASASPVDVDDLAGHEGEGGAGQGEDDGGDLPGPLALRSSRTRCWRKRRGEGARNLCQRLLASGLLQQMPLARGRMRSAYPWLCE